MHPAKVLVCLLPITRHGPMVMALFSLGQMFTNMTRCCGKLLRGICSAYCRYCANSASCNYSWGCLLEMRLLPATINC
jgi:hypothetical protein